MKAENAIAEIREFNRFYTNIISILDQSVLSSGHSLAEARILFELERQGPVSARKLMESITIDEGYLSRIVQDFVKRKLILKVSSKEDRRQNIIELTPEGKKVIKSLGNLADNSMAQMTSHLQKEQVTVLLGHMNNIKKLLSKKDVSNN